jgi:hypothetical protein
MKLAVSNGLIARKHTLLLILYVVLSFSPYENRNSGLMKTKEKYGFPIYSCLFKVLAYQRLSNKIVCTVLVSPSPFTFSFSTYRP